MFLELREVEGALEFYYLAISTSYMEDYLNKSSFLFFCMGTTT
jgi:hypothetical protein